MRTCWTGITEANLPSLNFIVEAWYGGSWDALYDDLLDGNIPSSASGELYFRLDRRGLLMGLLERVVSRSEKAVDKLQGE